MGFTPKVFIQSSQLETVLATVETGQGISLVPAMARKAFRLCAAEIRSHFPAKPKDEFCVAVKENA
jgi:DNA-binding transcriptional LysR family regulator